MDNSGGSKHDLTHEEQAALKEYQEYKKLRASINRPIRAFDDVESILKDLYGEGFPSLEEEIERSKKTKKAARPRLNQMYIR